ncbi:ABC transporter ATP-binding protein [Photobacterium sp. MCCC 1A19761]|uniref:ABC transporter ATP-binding protein n=1 Tax=Photobacterium sp. MCCC 1A19761 TaxID=3115000 RepID=UPI00307EAA1C
MQANAFSSLKWLLRVSGSQQTLLAAATLCTLLQVLLNLVPPVVIYLIIDGLHTAQLTEAEVMTYTLIAVGAALAKYLLMFTAALFSHHAAFRLVAAIKTQLTARLMHLPLAFFDQNRSADLRQVIDEDVDRIELFVAHHLNDLAAALLTPVLAAVVLFWFDWRLALVALVPIPLALGMQSVMYRGFGEKANRYYEALAEMNRQSTQLIRSVTALRMFTHAGGGMNPLRTSVQRYSVIVGDWMREASWPFAILKVALDFSLVLLLPVAAWMTLNHELSLGGFVLFMMLGLTLTEPFYNLMMFTGNLNQIMQGVSRINAVEQAETSEHGQAPFPTPLHTIHTEQLSYCFPGRATPAVEAVSLAIRAGEKIAIVGGSGSGKSTLMKLLSGYLKPQQGTIAFDGKPVTAYREQDFYRQVGIVMQTNHIFDTTLRENLAMGQPVDDAQIWQALSQAEARDFVQRLPQELDTAIGGHQVKLSGGEKQRLAIARQLLKSPEVYLFDEATSFFDPLIEVNMLSRLFSALEDKTFLFVTHRIAMAQKADRIVVMDQGKVVGFDRHDVLLQRCPEYQQLVAIHHQTQATVSKEPTYA